jgi:outer membrane protein assembly factor BamB
VRWETKVCAETAGKYFFHGDVLITPNLVFAGADVESGSGIEGGVHAFDTSTGQARWKYPSQRGVLAKIVGIERKLFAPTIKGELLCLDMDSGKRLWSLPLECSAWECAAIRTNRVFVGANDGSVYALNVKSGEVEWRTNLGARVTTSLAENGGRLYAGTSDGLIHRIDVRQGEILSSIKADANLKPASLPVVSNDAVLILLADEGNDHRAVVSVDLDLRRVRWRRATTDNWTTSRIFLTGTTFILGKKSGEITGYSTVDAEPVLSVNVAGTIRSISGFGDVIYVGTTEGCLYALPLQENRLPSQR